MAITILVMVFSIGFTILCRYKAGGSLSRTSGRISTIEPSYWLTKQQRQSREVWRSIGNTWLWVSALSSLTVFVQYFRGDLL